jgi:type IV pilus assembly protein PilV
MGLLDALIALVILSFGILGMTQFQSRMVLAASESQSRAVAVQLSEELLNTAVVDPANAACYTAPPMGGCGNAGASARTQAWAASAAERLPAPASAGAALDANGRLAVTLTWWGKESQEQRTLVGVTDVRP